MNIKSILTSFAVLCSGSALAAPVVIDFDTLAAPLTLTTQFAAQGVVFSSSSVINNTFGGQVVVPSGTNYVSFGDGFTITFVDPANASVAAVTDAVSFANLGILALGQYDGYTVSARDISGAEIGSESVLPVGPGSIVDPFNTSFSIAGIHSLVFVRLPNLNGSGIVGLDTLSFESVTPVPVPAALWLFGPALAGVSIARRRAA